MKRRLAVALPLSLLVCFNNQDSHAQFADRAVITGVVTDSSGAAIPDARHDYGRADRREDDRRY